MSEMAIRMEQLPWRWLGRRVKRLALAFVLAPLLAGAVHAASVVAGAPDPVWQSIVERQGRLEELVTQVGLELGGLIEEYDENGVRGLERDFLSQATDALRSVVRTELRPALDLLEKAKEEEPRARRLALLEISERQKIVSVTLRELALQYDSKRSLQLLRSSFEVLRARQESNLTELRGIRQEGGGIETIDWPERLRVRAQLLLVQQKHVVQEASAFVGALRAMSEGVPNPSQISAARAAAIVRDKGLDQALDESLAELGAGELSEAQHSFERVLGIVDELLAALRTPSNAKPDSNLASLPVIRNTLSNLIERQLELQSETASLAATPSRDDASRLAAEQMELANEALALQRTTAPLHAEAAFHLGVAQERMEAAQVELSGLAFNAGRHVQSEALGSLYLANRLLGALDPNPSLLVEARQALDRARTELREAIAADELTGEFQQGLESAQEELIPLAAGQHGVLPPVAEQAVTDGQEMLVNAEMALGQGNPGETLNAALSSNEALAYAAAALRLAEAGIAPSQLAFSGRSRQSSEGTGKGRGEASGEGQGEGQMAKGGKVSDKGSGQLGNWTGQSVGGGARRARIGEGRYLNLPGREQEALIHAAGDAYPIEYSSHIQRYWKRLAEESAQAEVQQ